DIASDLFGVVNANPDIVTNVYRDDEWFMNRHKIISVDNLQKKSVSYLAIIEHQCGMFFTGCGAVKNAQNV
ncbi:hypothetical protein SEEE5646_03065, partial [Salmonella enterica subsp. enterica serovar Enteritidis str. 50-5646]